MPGPTKVKPWLPRTTGFMAKERHLHARDRPRRGSPPTSCVSSNSQIWRRRGRGRSHRPRNRVLHVRKLDGQHQRREVVAIAVPELDLTDQLRQPDLKQSELIQSRSTYTRAQALSDAARYLRQTDSPYRIPRLLDPLLFVGIAKAECELRYGFEILLRRGVRNSDRPLTDLQHQYL